MAEPVTARSRSLSRCHVCGHVQPHAADPHKCARCRAPIHLRKPAHEAATWALLVAAIVMYVPANLLPILTMQRFGSGEPVTIIDGVVELWRSGMYPVASIVFVASIVVPVTKIVVLMILLFSLRRASRLTPRLRTRLYNATVLIGRWSMLDVFVIALLVALVDLGKIAVVTAGTGASAFAAVVILTMLAASRFDPRVMWDNDVRAR
ncbi:MAG: paraquat-inducible protein A [Chromatiales bacterium]|nr:paraquat-inducible protein A [Chromatiales bacterium]